MKSKLRTITAVRPTERLLPVRSPFSASGEKAPGSCTCGVAWPKWGEVKLRPSGRGEKGEEVYGALGAGQARLVKLLVARSPNWVIRSCMIRLMSATAWARAENGRRMSLATPHRGGQSAHPRFIRQGAGDQGAHE